MCNHNDNTPYKGLHHDGHNEEHERWSRRSFLQALGIAGAGTMMLGHNLISASAPSVLTAEVANVIRTTY